MKKIMAFGVFIVIAIGIVLIIIHNNHLKQQRVAAVFSCISQNNKYYVSIIYYEEGSPLTFSQVGQTLKEEQAANSQCSK